ncbi:IS30 family transposase [Rhizobium sp. BK313]|nr:IS30 family transposase [Rhizobium sp. BK313]
MEDQRRVITVTALDGERQLAVKKFGGIVMILDLHRQEMPVTAIARQTGVDRKTIRKYIERGLEAPAYGPRKFRSPDDKRHQNTIVDRSA